MDALTVSLIGSGIGLLLGSYIYTFLVQRDMTSRMENLDRDWNKTADGMRKARDEQLAHLRADAMAAISDGNVRLYEHRLQTATTFATVKSMEQMEGRLIALFGKIEIKVDRLTELVKNGHS